MDRIDTTTTVLDNELDTREAWWDIDSQKPVPPATVQLQVQATTAAPAPAAPKKEKPELLQIFDRAEAAAQNGDWAVASELFLTMIEKAPTFGPGYVGLASASFAVGDVTTGATALEHAISIYPDNAVLHSQLGVALAHTGHLERAQQAFLRVLDLEPNNIDAIVSLGHLCRVSRHFVEAVELFDQAHRLEPENPNVIGAIGCCALDLGDQAGAETALRKIRAIAPDHPEAQMLAERIRG
jgi:cytochrome c-type biogenesis protein CcmH/NrfG